MRWFIAALLAVVVVAGPAAAARPKKAARPPKAATTRTDKGDADKADKPETPAERAERLERAERPEGPSGMDPRTAGEAGAGARRSGPARIEFDDRLVQGQTNKANAIYLFERRESALRSLLKKRTDFHEQIDETLEEELMR
jgi:hypothetical protein